MKSMKPPPVRSVLNQLFVNICIIYIYIYIYTHTYHTVTYAKQPLGGLHRFRLMRVEERHSRGHPRRPLLRRSEVLGLGAWNSKFSSSGNKQKQKHRHLNIGNRPELIDMIIRIGFFEGLLSYNHNPKMI